MLCKLVLTFVPTFESVDEILWCDHSNESYRDFLVLLFMMMSQGGSYLLSLWMKSCSVTIQYLSQQYSSTVLTVLFLFLFFRFDV